MALTQLVRATRVQQLLDVSAWTLNRWIRDADFPVVRIVGVGRRFDLAEVQKWIDGRSKTVSKPTDSVANATDAKEKTA